MAKSLLGSHSPQALVDTMVVLMAYISLLGVEVNVANFDRTPAKFN